MNDLGIDRTGSIVLRMTPHVNDLIQRSERRDVAQVVAAFAVGLPNYPCLRGPTLVIGRFMRTGPEHPRMLCRRGE